MTRNLHYSCNPVRIVSDLKARGFKVIEAVNKLKWRSKEPLDMFILTFSADENTNKYTRLLVFWAVSGNTPP